MCCSLLGAGTAAASGGRLCWQLHGSAGVFRAADASGGLRTSTCACPSGRAVVMGMCQFVKRWSVACGDKAAA
jgi:hypothetical protein